MIAAKLSVEDTKVVIVTTCGRNVMDFVQGIQQKLFELRMERSGSNANYEGAPPDVANNIIADTMNLLETLFVVMNMPGDGFVSLTPRSQQNDDSEQESTG